VVPPTVSPGSTLPSSGRDWLRRGILTSLVLFAVGLLVLAGMSADTSNDDGVSISGDIVERLTPAPDDEVLSQTPIGLDLATGWGVQTLTVNDTPILEQDWDVTGELALYQFFPGDGTSLDRLKADRNCVQAQLFRLADPTETRTVDWCFTVA
jgi:hypothetical protein